MTMNIELVIGGQTARSKTGQHPVALDFDTLPEASKAFVIRYGLKQYLADGMAGCENVVDAKAGVDARVAKLLSGDLTRTKGEAAIKTDTPEGRALKNAKAAIKAAMKEANISLKDMAEAIAEAAQAKVASEPEWLEEAQAELAMEKKKASKIDISALIAKKAGV
jgi:hypothetical protein